VIRQGATGIIVPPCDEEQLYQALMKLSVDHELRRQMGRAARAEAEEQHSWRNTALQIDAIFQQVTRDRLSTVRSAAAPATIAPL
jgi:glycosyltransferase involved in cell wall biosynthesis